MNIRRSLCLTILTAATATPAFARPQGPIHCTGDQKMTLKGVEIRTDKTAVVADGDCTLKIEDCTLIGGKFGLLARNNADVKLKNCTVSGVKRGVRVTDNGTVKMRRGVLYNGARTAENGDFSAKKVRRVKRSLDKIPGGGYKDDNRVSHQIKPPPRKLPSRHSELREPDGAPFKTRRGPGLRVVPGVGKRDNKPVRCGGTQVIKLNNCELKGPGLMIDAKEACQVIVHNCQIRSTKGVAIRLQGDARLKLVNCQVRGKKAALVLRDNADATVKSSQVVGKLRRHGNSTLHNKSSMFTK